MRFVKMATGVIQRMVAIVQVRSVVKDGKGLP